ncbi:MFS transporter [Actibacterium ureilyticum]|uniref:MFS transporter n=1 Tax=Actibacterium ureilyticum TaxID=1590614 RepID=UPI000BAACD7F|nr:MFS transporter [Actibacterium ureilyticum]
MSDRSETALLLVLTLWAAGLCAAGQFAKISVSYGALADIYPQAGAALGYALSLISLLGVVLGATAGALVGWLGFRLVLLAALLLGAAVSLIQAALPGFGLFLLSRVVEGVSHLAIVVAAPTLIAQVTAPRHQAAAMTLWSCFFGVAYAVFAWAGIPLIRAAGPAPLYAIHAGGCLAVAAALWLMLPRDRAGAAVPPRLSRVLTDLAAIYRSPRTNAAALGWLCYTFTFVAILTLLSQIVGEGRAAGLIGAMPLVSIGTSLTLGVALLQRIPAERVLIAGFAAALIVLGLIGLMPGAAWPFLVLAMVWGLIQGAGFAMVPQLNDTVETRARANGAMAQMGNLGNLLGTPVLAALLLAGGLNAVLLAILAIYGCAIAVQLWLARLRAQAATG